MQVPGMYSGDDDSLIMPFLAAASNGGPYDDDAYIAGFEVGTISAAFQLGMMRNGQWLVRVENERTLDLMAMRYGYRMERAEMPGDMMEFLQVEFVK